MKYYSTNKLSPLVGFREATLFGLAPDKGLYFPEKIPRHGQSFFENMHSLPNEEIAYQVIAPYVGDAIPGDRLRSIVAETVNFPIPLVSIEDGIFALELFHGPTLAFKDVGARFMSRCLSYFVTSIGRKVTVLVATSGDTGSAVADGFFGQEGIDVVILYPSGMVSQVQEQQLTTHGANIHAIEVEGCFDDCQQMVRQAFVDQEFSGLLTSANSINIARWLPQQFYYFFAWKQWEDKDCPPCFSVPSGNFGNLAAGMLAAYAGLPAGKFIAACNANDVVTRYLLTGEYQPHPTIATLSNAMDVGNPGNFIRIEELYRHYLPELREHLVSFSITDEETRAAIDHVYTNDHYRLDPHGAVAFEALRRYLGEHPDEKGIFLETAHPVKFPSIWEEMPATGLDIPGAINDVLSRKKSAVKMKANYNQLRQFLAELG